MWQSIIYLLFFSQFSHNSLTMTNSNDFVIHIIFYIKSQTQTLKTIEILNILDNDSYVKKVISFLEFVDISLKNKFDFFLTIHFLFYNNDSSDQYDRVSRKNTSDLYSICSRIIRLQFKFIESLFFRDFEFEVEFNFDVKTFYFSKYLDRNSLKVYFWIYYNFDSDALLITILIEIMIESVNVKKHQFLLLMINTSIYCEEEFEFTIEFSNINKCVEEYERNYKQYVTNFNFFNAQYLSIFWEEYLSINVKHNSVIILNKKKIELVHKALNIKNDKQCAIKVLFKNEKKRKKINVISKLSHVNSLMIIMSIY